jgi:hypothetical protein
MRTDIITDSKQARELDHAVSTVITVNSLDTLT